MKIQQLPAHQRPREKLLEKGPQGLTDEELIAILIRIGTKGKSAIQLGNVLLKKYSLYQLLNITFSELSQIKGLGSAKATQLMAAFELANRAKESPQNQPLLNPEQIINILSEYKNKKKEHFIALYLNARHKLLFQETISIGHLTASLVHPRELFKPALEHSAAYIIIVHNHPSNDPQPSKEDLLLTQRLSQAGQLLDIPILDHLIITQDSWSSLKQLGYFNSYRQP